MLTIGAGVVSKIAVEQGSLMFTLKFEAMFMES
jgi:hypothetical protein